MSGLSVAQNSGKQNGIIVGCPENELAPIHPLYNIGLDVTIEALRYFQQLPVPNIGLKS